MEPSYYEEFNSSNNYYSQLIFANIKIEYDKYRAKKDTGSETKFTLTFDNKLTFPDKCMLSIYLGSLSINNVTEIPVEINYKNNSYSFEKKIDSKISISYNLLPDGLGFKEFKDRLTCEKEICNFSDSYAKGNSDDKIMNDSYYFADDGEAPRCKQTINKKVDGIVTYKPLFFMEPIWQLETDDLYTEYDRLVESKTNTSCILFRANILNHAIIVYNLLHNTKVYNSNILKLSKMDETAKKKNDYITLVELLIKAYKGCEYKDLRSFYIQYFEVIENYREERNEEQISEVKTLFTKSDGMGESGSPVLFNYCSVCVPDEKKMIKLYCTKIINFSAHPWLRTHNFGIYGTLKNVIHDYAHKFVIFNYPPGSERTRKRWEPREIKELYEGIKSKELLSAKKVLKFFENIGSKLLLESIFDIIYEKNQIAVGYSNETKPILVCTLDRFKSYITQVETYENAFRIYKNIVGRRLYDFLILMNYLQISTDYKDRFYNNYLKEKKFTLKYVDYEHVSEGIPSSITQTIKVDENSEHGNIKLFSERYLLNNSIDIGSPVTDIQRVLSTRPTDKIIEKIDTLDGKEQISVNIDKFNKDLTKLGIVS